MRLMRRDPTTTNTAPARCWCVPRPFTCSSTAHECSLYGQLYLNHVTERVTSCQLFCVQVEFIVKLEECVASKLPGAAPTADAPASAPEPELVRLQDTLAMCYGLLGVNYVETEENQCKSLCRYRLELTPAALLTLLRCSHLAPSLQPATSSSHGHWCGSLRACRCRQHSFSSPQLRLQPPLRVLTLQQGGPHEASQLPLAPLRRARIRRRPSRLPCSSLARALSV
jgi:hypothetical protein